MRRLPFAIEVALAALAGALLVVAVSSCATIPVYAPKAGHVDKQAIDVAASGLGFGADYVADPQGAVEVQLRPRTDVDGRAQRKVCKRQIESTTDTAVLRHGLGHVDDPQNVMTPHVGHDADHLTKEQRQRMAAELTILRVCREGRR